MQRDYKKRPPKRANSKKQFAVSWWKWLLIVLLIVAFGSFLYFLKSSPKDSEQTQVKLSLPNPEEQKKNTKQETKPAIAKKETETTPKFEFYTYLPDKEVVVPDHEIKTRTREERVGKAKKHSYMMQAGSFRNYDDADSFKAQLAFMGIESKIEKANIRNTTWNRVKIGPFKNMSRVNEIRTKLRQQNIDVVVMEID